MLEAASELIYNSRQSMHRILHGMDDRLIVVIGPCSIHDTKAAIEYAGRLVKERERFKGELEIVMRVYFEPRTTVGWKGLINDPHLDNSFKINEGLRTARELLLQINEMGLPAATEYLDMISPQYIADLISWGAIGARTTESQVHREPRRAVLPGRLQERHRRQREDRGRCNQGSVAAAPFPVGDEGWPFGDRVDGGQRGLPRDPARRQGAELRGQRERRVRGHRQAGLAARLMIDASHANSSKKHENQIPVCADIGRQIAAGDARIVGVMIESHLVEGRQDLKEGCELTYGQSITDACIAWDDSVKVLEGLAESVKARRVTRGSGN